MELKHKVFGSVGTAPISQKEQDIKNENKTMEDDLQSLIELGCVRDEITLDNKTFRMRTLNSFERVSLSNFLGESPSVEKLLEFNIKFLSISIETVNGKLFEDYHPEKEKDPMIRKQELLRAMQSSALGKLIMFYNEITKRSDSKFTPEEIKN